MGDESSLDNQKILVTGASGFIGSHLCRRLSKLGADVHATSREMRTSARGGPCWWYSTLIQIDSVREIFSKVRPDVVYHLAGSVGASTDKELVLPTFQSLLTSTVNILIGATEVGCRRVILSGSLTEPCSADFSPTPSSPYAAAKWAASTYGRMFHVLYKTPTVTVTPFMTFGPGQQSSKLVPSVILSLLKQEAPRLTSGLWEADWVYIDDVITGFLDAAVVSGIEGATFDLGTGAKRTVREVVEIIVKLMDSSLKPQFGVLQDRPREPVRIADMMETRGRLGWSAKTSLEDGLRQTIQWYVEQTSTIKPS